MKKKLLSFVLLCAAAFVSSFGNLYAQNSPTVTNAGDIIVQSQYPDTGVTCSPGGLVRDDNTYENGYQWSVDSSAWVHKLIPPSVPFTINAICVAWTRTSSGQPNITFDLVVYDTTGAGGGPGNLLGIVPGVQATNIAIYPLHSRYRYEGFNITVNSGVYVGVRFDNNPTNYVYISVDENGTVNGNGYYRITNTYPPTWISLPSAQAPNWRNFGIRAEGVAGVQRNFALSLPTPGVNTNYVLIPFQSSMVGFQNVTIEAWVKIGSSATGNTVLNKGAGSYDYQLGINAGTTNPYFRAQGVIVTANTMTIHPVWTHLAVTYDGTTVRFYKDGALGFSQVQSAPLGTSTNEMRIGRGNAEPGSGNLEEVRLWTVARTQQQIDSNKCRKYRTSFTNSGGLLALWHFDSTYVDSISSYNGTPFGNLGFDTVSYPPPGANCIPVGITHNQNEIPSSYSLEQNYPNPFNPSTTIKFSLPKGEFVELILYDLSGRELAAILRAPFEAGVYTITFDASKFASGIYFYKITAGNFTDSKKMSIIK